MAEPADTLEKSAEQAVGSGVARPGAALLFADGAAALRVSALAAGAELELGRQAKLGLTIEDGHMSRRHAAVRREEGGGWRVRDLGSRNGTFVDGRRISDERVAEGRHLVRVGGALVALLPDAGGVAGRNVELVEGQVVGPTLGTQLALIGRLAAQESVLHLRGETGSGKELAARRFHQAGPRPAGPFVAVNCGAVPRELAEALLFGARKGAFTGAVADSDGYLASADGGTIFLDEVGELPPAVQAKLLRVLETREVLPLGATRGRAVDLRVCSATHKDLRLEAAEKRFREDLYFRLGRPAVLVPPLRQRLEEIAFLVRLAVDRADAALRIDAGLVEACLLRPWPGNVRELLTEVRAGARRALDETGARVEARHLDVQAGKALAGGTTPAPRVPRATMGMLSVDGVVAALKREGGNLSRAARSLGVHRTQVKRFIARHNIAVLRDDDA